MNNTYVIESEDIFSMLDNVDYFKEKLDKFIKVHDKYRYNISFSKTEDKKWNVEFNITNE